MKHFNLYNTAHPMAGGGRPIFVPFGEWPYDRARRQRLDRAHGEAIANELNPDLVHSAPGDFLRRPAEAVVAIRDSVPPANLRLAACRGLSLHGFFPPVATSATLP